MITTIKSSILRSRFQKVCQKYQPYTMMPSDSFVDHLMLVNAYKHIEGDVVECGVWRGGAIAGIAEILGEGRTYYLFDSFEGLPDAKEIDGEHAIAWQQDKESPTYYDNCKAEMGWAEKAMKLSGAPNFELIKGWFDDTIPAFEPENPIAILRLDGDWYDSTMICLKHLYPKVAKGGLIILDDYYAWDGCSKALHDYLSEHQSNVKIREAYTSGCYLVKS